MLPLPGDALPLPHALPRLLEVSHVAHRLSASQEFVRRLIRESRLPAIRLGTRWRVDPRDLESYIDACRTAHVRANDDRGRSHREDRSA
jgi:excisionase family DNA binding protein